MAYWENYNHARARRHLSQHSVIAASLVVARHYARCPQPKYILKIAHGLIWDTQQSQFL